MTIDFQAIKDIVLITVPIITAYYRQIIYAGGMRPISANLRK